MLPTGRSNDSGTKLVLCEAPQCSTIAYEYPFNKKAVNGCGTYHGTMQEQTDIVYTRVA